MKKRRSSEADDLSGGQEIPRRFWNAKVHHRVHNSPPPVPKISQTNKAHV
jgi:hypothetical protein